ncbi:MAG: NAD(P)H-binding protein [Phycisphaeraceae bacterium]|nr:NAD(P)H-binding protein [Phycisphaeraceae bacterium]MCW5764169.1 NAD(P)H-binding protein [Phycisphaeraceae bacterium]
MTIKNVAVTGATGFVGRFIVDELLARGYAVRALARDRAKAIAVLPQRSNLEVVVGEVGDASACCDLVAPAQACIHLVGIIRPVGRQTFERIHVGATRHMLEACAHAGVSRYVHMSALGASPLSRAEYQRSKFAAETLVRASGLDWTIFRPGLIHGAQGEFMRMAAKWCRSAAPPHIFLPYFSRRERGPAGSAVVTPTIDPVYVLDVARAFCDALERPTTVGEIYPLVGGSPLDWRAFLTTLRDALPNVGPRLEAIGLPGELMAMKARMATMVGLGNFLPFDEGMALMGQQDSTASLTKTQAHLNYAPIGFRNALPLYAASM